MKNKKERGRKMKNKKAFTLIELMIVMAIIAVLVVLMVAAIQAARRSSTETQNRGNAKTIETGLEAAASRNAGVYCQVADPVATQPPRCASTNLKAVADDLVTGGFLSSTITGTCVSTAGMVSLTASTFTITVPDYSCAGSIQSIKH
jgi:prepilin-type N-terminal cleavage/methylation domain-containing protein